MASAMTNRPEMPASKVLNSLQDLAYTDKLSQSNALESLKTRQLSSGCGEERAGAERPQKL